MFKQLTLLALLVAFLTLKNGGPEQRLQVTGSRTVADHANAGEVTQMKTPGVRQLLSRTYTADIEGGQIGVSGNLPFDKASDNIFHVQIPELPANAEAWLQYDLLGASDHSSVPRSINDAQAIGGQLVCLSNEWSFQKEAIPSSLLKQGDNVIRFSLPEDATYNYRIRSLSVVVTELSEKQQPGIVINKALTHFAEGKWYIKGIVRGAEHAQLFCNNYPTPVFDNEFEIMLPSVASTVAELKLIIPGQDPVIVTTVLEDKQSPAQLYPSAEKGIRKEQVFTPGQPLSISATPLVAASLFVPSNALSSTEMISITALRTIDLPALGPDLINVTAGSKGYRFLPHGTSFAATATIQLPYDSSLIPEGYTPDDIRTYYFDEIKKEWIELSIDTVLKKDAQVLSGTSHFTDMINAIISVPESPQSLGYIPTSIKDIKAANPSTGISLLEPPGAGSTGSANLSFQVKIPKGRQGMEPSVNIGYNSDGGNGWLGIGWSLNLPAIGIDSRWGVPRYNPAFETETYTLNGEQLAPIVHKGVFVARSIEKQFHPRIEKQFQKIIRHGDHPSNYWWEVTDKNGTRHFYGGYTGTGVYNEGIIKDDANNIAQWALLESIDLSGNHVRYVYDLVRDDGVVNGSVPGWQLYIREITYTGFGKINGHYKIEFLRDRDLRESRRKDIEINARLGLKMVTADLLRKIHVSFKGTRIRSYDLVYGEGAFNKTLLKSISELDNNGAVFNTHELQYYDEVNTSGGFRPFSVSESWDPQDDGLVNQAIANPIPGWTNEATVLSSSKSSGRSNNLAVTLGLWDGEFAKTLTVGGTFGSSNTNTEGMASLLDINGDGLPDKIFKKNGQLLFRPNLGGAQRTFGDLRPITGISNFINSNARTSSRGLEVNLYNAFVGRESSTTVNTTTQYLNDFNGDGLIDLASNGQVFFNRLDQNGNPQFLPGSTGTPSLIINTNTVNPVFLAPDTALQSQQERDHPLQDAIRFWEAPFDGTVSVNAPVHLIDFGTVNNRLDGVRVSIQHQQAVRWQTSINANDFSVKTPQNVNSISVVKGDRIYFRLQSVYNGDNDVVQWDPVVTYLNTLTPAIDANGRLSRYYRASDDYVLHNKKPYPMAKAGKIRIEGTFIKGITSDTVHLLIRKKSAGVISVPVERIFSRKQLYNDLLLAELDVLAADTLWFTLYTDSYIDRAKLNWRPQYHFISFADGTSPYNNNGQPLIQDYVVPDNSNNNDWYVKADFQKSGLDDSISVWPGFTAPAGLNGAVWFSVKGPDTLYGKRLVQISNGVISNDPDSIRIGRFVNDTLFYAFDGPRELTTLLQAPNAFIKRDSSFIRDGNVIDTVLLERHPASVYTPHATEFLGTLFRGWGHFSFRGDPANAPLDITKINLDALQNYSSDPSLYQDPAALDQIIDVSQTEFVPMYAKSPEWQWAGFDTSVYVRPATMSSSRLWMHDVKVDSLMAGAGLSAVNKVSKTSNTNTAYGASFVVGVSRTSSEASTSNMLDMMDLNADRHPDIVQGDRIQYSLPNGGLGNDVSSHNLGGASFKGESTGMGMGGGGSFPVASAKNSPQGNAQNISTNAEAQVGLSLSANVSGSENDDETVSTWLDINGDGLPDKIFANGSVGLNLGYRFAPAENWGYSGIITNSSEQFSSGGGFGANLFNTSFQYGFGLLNNKSHGKTAFEDLNGDGLPDKISLSSGNVIVQLNRGNGFGPAINWNGLSIVNRNSSVGESHNTAFTAAIPIPLIIVTLKLCINPSFGSSDGVSRENDLIADVDGDGFPDILHSGNDGQLIVERSAIGRTNLLHSVKRPMGSTFSLQYERAGNNYRMPQSKWVLTGLQISDGVPGDGIDTMRQRFSYYDGFFERDQRDFYGFARVISEDLNTASNDQVYRRQVREFFNSSYYNKGLLAKEWTENGAGQKFVQTNYEYEIRSVRDSSRFAALVQKQTLRYEGSPVAGASTFVRMDYDQYGNVKQVIDAGDGSQNDMITASITYHNNEQLYLKDIPADIEVQSVEGLKRKRSTDIDNTGNVMRIRQYLTSDSIAIYDLEYDLFGNLSKITRPSNRRQQRMWYGYTYDPEVNTYVIQIDDAFGYTSRNEYNYLFGELTGTTSIQGEQIRYEVDNHGRLVRVTGPYELAAGKPYTIAFEYFPFAEVPYAVTRHYDPAYNSDLRTITFSDGIGRALQVKKQTALFRARGEEDDVQMTVSGKSIFDAFGRIVETYYPRKEPVGPDNIRLSVTPGEFMSRSSFDVLDRTRSMQLADGATTSHAYSIQDGLNKLGIRDALSNVRETFTDMRGRTRITKLLGGPDGVITTKFDYNAMDELIRVEDTRGNIIRNQYDNLGRMVSVNHPDAGLTEYEIDLAGNLVRKTTAQIRQEIPQDGAIKYGYDYERLVDIDYPRQYQNKVTYKYGGPGMGNRTGRLTLQMDASGGSEYYYGKLGEITKTIRTVLVNSVFYTTYVTEQEYDTWNRLTKMVYPDGEELTYRYNRGGNLRSISGSKLGNSYDYVSQLGYDEFDQRIYLRYGNGTETKYSYDPQRRRMDHLQASTASGRLMMDNAYGYDAVSNILSVTNNASSVPGTLGGAASHSYQYDKLYRLTKASGTYHGATDTASYALDMKYDDLYNITRKSLWRSRQNASYDNTYEYGAGTPHRAVKVGVYTYGYDLNGNQTGFKGRQYFWDEENRLMAAINGGNISRYTYDASGERVIKSSGGLQGMWVNGAPAGIINHDSNYVAYVSPYVVCRKAGFTKHIYIENQRIASKVGIGRFNNISFPHTALTAGGINYIKRQDELQRQRYTYYASIAGLSPGPPWDKMYFAHPYNSGIAAPVLVDSTRNSIPVGWPGNTTPPINGGPPVFVSPIPSNDSVKAGYGFVGTGHFYEQQQYFYHPDHLGSTSYVTDLSGEISQHQEYIAFGETFYEEHNRSYKSPYLFNAKERDAETGLYYYGARYYDPVQSQWISVDPLAEKYPHVSPYVFCLNNPIVLIDPDGMEAILIYHNKNDEGSLNSFAEGAIKGAAGDGTVTITSTKRDASEQISAMYKNTSRTGSEYQKKVYSAKGDKVIDAYVDAKKEEGSTSESVKSKMLETAIEVGFVSDHSAADYDKKNVVDVQLNGVKEKDFISDMKKTVPGVVIRKENKVLHLEIPIPAKKDDTKELDK